MATFTSWTTNDAWALNFVYADPNYILGSWNHLSCFNSYIYETLVPLLLEKEVNCMDDA